MYDGSGSIGRRYARADEIGIPLCITVDHQSLEDGTVTLRDRDTGEQTRVLMNTLS
jgi:glycyl-tRNA synthetase